MSIFGKYKTEVKKMDPKKQFKELIKIRWYCDKLLNERFYIEDEDLKELTTLLKPFTNKYNNTTPIFNYEVEPWDYLTYLDNTIDNIIFKAQLKGINKTLLKRYYLMLFELEYINNFEDIEDLKDLSINLMDSLQTTTLIKTYDDIAQKNINNYEGLYKTVERTLKIETNKIIRGFYQ